MFTPGGRIAFVLQVPGSIDTGGGESWGKLSTGSTAEASQTVDTPDMAFALDFLFRFPSSEGVLELLLDGQTLDTLDASVVGPMSDFAAHRTDVLDPALAHLEDVPLTFRLDGPTGTEVHFDEVSLRGIPEPATLALLALGGLAMLRRRTA
ncbi:MAG: PEP-CTERM sorting domain-containing protein [Phycisphaerae bacterium]